MRTFRSQCDVSSKEEVLLRNEFMSLPKGRREDDINSTINSKLRGILNDAWVALKERGMENPTLQHCKEYIRELILTGPGPDPSAWSYQADRFPFEYGEDGWIGDLLQEINPTVYQRVR